MQVRCHEKPLSTAANCLPDVQNIIWISHAGLPHVLHHRHTKRHNLNSLLPHTLRHWWDHGSVLRPWQVSLQVLHFIWLSGPPLVSLRLMPHTHT